MISELSNHLWQSTVFAFAVALVAIAHARRLGLFVSVERLLAAVIALDLILMMVPASFAQSLARSVTTNAPEFRYDVVSIKPNKSGVGGRAQIAPDGFSEKSVSLKGLILRAFGLEEFQLSGVTGWLESERFDIDAKMDTAAADALQKLNPDDQRIARQHMLQAVLADRFQFTFHRENRAFPVYSLIIAKNGPKLHEAKPGDTYSNGIKYPNGGGGAGAIMMRLSSTSHTLTAQAVQISALVSQLRLESLGRPILDKTGLTGKYDFILTYVPENISAPAPGAAGASPTIPTDQVGPSLFTALEDQLGLKLDAGRAPIEIIVIDHVERPSEN